MFDRHVVHKDVRCHNAALACRKRCSRWLQQGASTPCRKRRSGRSGCCYHAGQKPAAPAETWKGHHRNLWHLPAEQLAAREQPRAQGHREDMLGNPYRCSKHRWVLVCSIPVCFSNNPNRIKLLANFCECLPVPRLPLWCCSCGIMSDS